MEDTRMTKKVLSYGAVGLLAAVLLGGTAYIVLNPTDARAQSVSAGGPGRSRESGEIWQSGEEIRGGASANSQGQGRGRRNASGAETALNQGAYASGSVENLSAEEIQGILFMREEEKLARDVYLTLYEQWELAIFKNIASSEQTHMDAVGTLIERYGLEDPADGNDVGEYADPTLQSLYSDLIANGTGSLGDALRVGAAIEEIDILDLEKYLSQTNARDVERVYQNLLRGSRNHLRSFVGTLAQQAGETYEPLYLEPQAFDDIVSAAVEGGGYGQGRGRGGAGQLGSDGLAADYGQGGGRGNRNPAEASGRNATERAGEMVAIEWETVTGSVIHIDSEVTIQTTGGEVLIGMGQSAFWEDFAMAVGDQISVDGFYEDGEFKAGTVENLTSGEAITLRDQTGRPVWSGQGRLKNQNQ
jgi:hypothetical protein